MPVFFTIVWWLTAGPSRKHLIQILNSDLIVSHLNKRTNVNIIDYDEFSCHYKFNVIVYVSFLLSLLFYFFTFNKS